MVPAERALATALRWTLAGAALALPALLINLEDHVVAVSTWHLIAIVAFEVALAISLMSSADRPGWFSGLAGQRREFAGFDSRDIMEGRDFIGAGPAGSRVGLVAVSHLQVLVERALGQGREVAPGLAEAGREDFEVVLAGMLNTSGSEGAA